jgi:hypothetical protein
MASRVPARSAGMRKGVFLSPNVTVESYNQLIFGISEHREGSQQEPRWGPDLELKDKQKNACQSTGAIARTLATSTAKE